MEPKNKYEGTMFSHCDTALTDLMLFAKKLVKKVEYLVDNLDNTTIEAYSDLFIELDRKIVERCVTPNFQLSLQTRPSAKEQFRSLLFHIKYVCHEIYTAWVAGTSKYAPAFGQCVSEIDSRLCQEEKLRWALNNMK